MKCLERNGSLVEAYDGEGQMIEFLYGNAFGQKLLKILIQPWVSRLAGSFLDHRLSRFLVKPFIRKNRLDLKDYPDRSYTSFNDFFCRRILDGKRPIEEDEMRLISPCDGKLTFFPLGEDECFTIKGCSYTLETLLKSSRLPKHYSGGWGILLRLSVDDYHRYIYPVSGRKSGNYRIRGVYHTVNPRAVAARQIYRENTREFTVLQSEVFGNVLMMEVGAMLVGRIKNEHGVCTVSRGQEKGHFEYGGSSILLLTEPGFLRPDPDLLENSEKGMETIVRMGEGIGSLLFTLPASPIRKTRFIS